MQLHGKDFEALEAMDEDLYAKVKESDFTRRLLPHLVPSEDGSEKPGAAAIYIAAAGHPSRMIAVVDDKDPTKTLYLVPPLVSQTPMTIRDENSHPNTSINVLADQFDMEILNNHPGYVIDTFVNKLVALNYTPADAVSMAYSRMWAHIYKRYNIPLERLFGDRAAEVSEYFGLNDTAPASTEIKGIISNDFDDDDFDPM